jgi:hypothetical protein
MEQHEKPLAHTKRPFAGRPKASPLAQRIDAAAVATDRILNRKLDLHYAGATVFTIDAAYRDHLPGKDHARQPGHRMKRVGYTLSWQGLGKSGLRRLLRNHAIRRAKSEDQCKYARKSHCPWRRHTAPPPSPCFSSKVAGGYVFAVFPYISVADSGNIMAQASKVICRKYRMHRRTWSVCTTP